MCAESRTFSSHPLFRAVIQLRVRIAQRFAKTWRFKKKRAKRTFSLKQQEIPKNPHLNNVQARVVSPLPILSMYSTTSVAVLTTSLWMRATRHFTGTLARIPAKALRLERQRLTLRKKPRRGIRALWEAIIKTAVLALPICTLLWTVHHRSRWQLTWIRLWARESCQGATRPKTGTRACVK